MSVSKAWAGKCSGQDLFQFQFAVTSVTHLHRLLMISRPPKDGRLSWPWCRVADRPRTYDLAIASPALKQIQITYCRMTLMMLLTLTGAVLNYLLRFSVILVKLIALYRCIFSPHRPIVTVCMGVYCGNLYTPIWVVFVLCGELVLGVHGICLTETER